MPFDFRIIEHAIRENLPDLTEGEVQPIIQKVSTLVRDHILRWKLEPKGMYQIPIFERDSLKTSGSIMDEVSVQMKKQVHLVITCDVPISERYLQLLQNAYGKVVYVHCTIASLLKF